MLKIVEVFCWENEGGGFEEGLAKKLDEGWDVLAIETIGTVIHVYAWREKDVINNIKEIAEEIADAIREIAKSGHHCYDEEDRGVADRELINAITKLVKEVMENVKKAL